MNNCIRVHDKNLIIAYMYSHLPFVIRNTITYIHAMPGALHGSTVMDMYRPENMVIWQEYNVVMASAHLIVVNP